MATLHFKRIGHRLLAAVGTVVVIGLVAVVLVYARQQEASILEENELALTKVTDSVAEGLTALMLREHPKAAEEFAGRLRNIPRITDYRIMRADGTEAFVDNSTANRVNEKLGDLEFPGRKGDPAPSRVLAVSDPNLEQLRVTGQKVVSYQTLPGGDRQVTILSPIKAQPGCEKCHEKGESIRGVIKLTTSLAQVEEDVRATWRLSLVFIGVGLVAMVALIYWLAHRTVVSQLAGISHAMEVAATGDLSVRLPVRGGDELGHMAHSFNRMNEELLQIYAGLQEERNKLNTIIRGADSGIVVTDAKQRVVLVNSAARKLVGKDEQRMIEEGFLGLFDDEEWMKAELARARHSSAPAIREWNGRVLSIQSSTIRDAEHQIIGSACLVRDITEEKRLEAQLKKQSITDALTGLFNRRHFDTVMLAEFKRWKRYHQPVSVIMLDVDHFKRFNDTHGHECGDKVLVAIGKLLLAISSPAVVPCRYGGEEMVVILPGNPQGEALVLAETIRTQIAELVIDGLQVTVSLGVAGCPGHDVGTPDDLVKLADDALYRAKQGGRNRACAAELAVPAETV